MHPLSRWGPSDPAWALCVKIEPFALHNVGVAATSACLPFALGTSVPDWQLALLKGAAASCFRV